MSTPLVTSEARLRYQQARRVALLAWLALLLLLAASAASAWLHLGAALLPASMLIAVAKAGIVGWIFMELRQRQPLLRLAAASGLVILLLLAGLSLVDVLVRKDEAVPWQRPATVRPLAAYAARRSPSCEGTGSRPVADGAHDASQLRLGMRAEAAPRSAEICPAQVRPCSRSCSIHCR